MILDDINEEETKILKASATYMKKQHKSSKIITDDNVRVPEDL